MIIIRHISNHLYLINSQHCPYMSNVFLKVMKPPELLAKELIFDPCHNGMVSFVRTLHLDSRFSLKSLGTSDNVKYQLCLS